MQVKVLYTEEADRAVPLPSYETAGAAGADIRANFGAEGTGLTLEPGARALVPTGLIFEIEDGYEVQVRPRSGLALKHGIAVVNAPGTIDSDYRGKIGVLLINHGQAPFEVTHGARIAQLVAAPVTRAVFEPAQTVTNTKRGTGGYGSTGTG